jgi:ABC transporter substrate binding protein
MSGAVRQGYKRSCSAKTQCRPRSIGTPAAIGSEPKRITLALRHSLPSVYQDRTQVAEGGLLSYGADMIEIYRTGGVYVDRILRGAKPGDLPVQFPTKFQFVVNLKTGKAIGLDVSPSVCYAPTRLSNETPGVHRGFRWCGGVTGRITRATTDGGGGITTPEGDAALSSTEKPSESADRSRQDALIKFGAQARNHIHRGTWLPPFDER